MKFGKYSISEYIKQVKLYARNPLSLFDNWATKGRLNWMPDKWYLTFMFRSKMGYWMDWKNPKSFCEKLNWLKVNDHNPLYHKLVDKIEVKEFVSKKIGEMHLIKTLFVYDSVDQIDFNQLPNQFVLKCTHDSGSVIICKDKSSLNIQETKAKLSRHLSVNDYYLINREWAYKGVKPRIIAEEFIDTLMLPSTEEYKITCINGKPKMITLCSGIAHGVAGTRFNDHFDKNFNRLDFYVEYPPAGKTIVSTPLMQKLFSICEILAKDIPQVRIDFYNHSGKILFGEMTFYTWGGFMQYNPPKWDNIMGSWLKLP